MTTHTEKDGTVRQDHYGSGRQPWDDIVDNGWGVAFAAGNVLKYLRRTKHPEHSLESAKWYWTRLHEFAHEGDLYAIREVRRLRVYLSNEELAKLDID